MDLTTEALTETAKEAGGYARAARALLTVPEEDRAAVLSEGTIFANTSPGWRWASAIAHVAARFVAGDRSTPLIDWNRKEIERERAARGLQALAVANRYR
jgi:hypothetical protein